jgi:outer membrane protein assembly factor BamB
MIMAHTRPVLLSFALCSLLTSLASGQRWIHAPTIDVNPSRDSHYSAVDAFGPPFTLTATHRFGGSDAGGFYPIEDGFLVTSFDGAYRFWSRSGQQSGETSLLWSTTALPALPPAYSRGIVILASSTTTSVQAVRIEDGHALWSGPGVGDLNHSPVASGDTVFFQGNHRLLAADLEDGTIVWERTFPGGFANAPLALSDGLLFVLGRAGTLHALTARSGDEIWSTAEAGGVDSTVAASPELVFVTRYNRITAFGTTNGAVQWEHILPGGSIRRLAYAQGRVFATFPPPGQHGMPVPEGTANTIVALQAHSGSPIWRFREEADYPPPLPVTPSPYWSVISDLFVAGGRVYFFNQSLGRARTLNADSGALEWNMRVGPGVQSMKLSDRELVLLYAERIEMYGPAERLYLAEFAEGEGYSIHLTVNNSHQEPVNASIVFRSTSGDETSFTDVAGMPLQTGLSVPPLSSATLIIPDVSQPVQTGWVQIDSAAPLTASLIYQYAPGGILKNEVGVADSLPTDFVNVKVSHGNGFSTAVALAVPGDQEALISVQLLDAEGDELAENDFSLGSQEQMAKFFHELLHPDLSFNAFEGTLVIRADQPIIVTALRTKDGTPISSFPVGRKR